MKTLINPIYRRFLSYARPYRWWIGGATLFGLLKFNLPIVFPLVVKQVIDLLIDDPQAHLAKINWWMFGLVLLFLGYTISSYLRSYLADFAAQRMIFDLRNQFYQHLQRLSLDFFEKRQVGALSSRLIADISIAQNFIGAAFTNAVMDLSTLLLIAIILLQENWKLACIAIAILPFYAWINTRFQIRIKNTASIAQSQLEEITSHVHERLAAVSIVQAYAAENKEEIAFFRNARKHLGSLLINVKNNAMAIATVGLITSLSPVIVFWFGIQEVANGDLTPGGLVAFYVLLGMFFTPLSRLTDLNILFANSRSAMERIFEVLDNSPTVPQPKNPIILRNPKGNIRFNNVQFSYRNDRPVLADISLDITAGETLALVGKSGSGKSTFAKLIARFYDVSDGSILIDDLDLRQLDLRSLRRHIALGTQEPILFSGSIFENIRYGKPDASPEEVVKAAQSADAHEFIESLSDGYNTIIGERGVTLSGGQKQRLTLARAFLKDAPILILDEATSSLDSESENAIRKALIRLMEGRTTIVIAHRLSTVLAADRIAVFDQGRIVQLGNHKALMAQGDGPYRRLYTEQFQETLSGT